MSAWDDSQNLDSTYTFLQIHYCDYKFIFQPTSRNSQWRRLNHAIQLLLTSPRGSNLHNSVDSAFGPQSAYMRNYYYFMMLVLGIRRCKRKKPGDYYTRVHNYIVWRKDVRFNYEIINIWPMIVSCVRSPNVEKLLAVSDS